MTLKLQGQLSSAYRFQSFASKHCFKHANLPTKSIQKNPIIFDKIQEESDSECNSWKIYAFYNTLNAVNRSFAMNPHEGNAYSRPDKPVTGLDKAPELIPFYGYCLPELPEIHVASLLEKLKALHLHLLAAEHWNASHLKLCHRNYLVSATNLTHYLAFRCLDLQQLKGDLSAIGLPTLESINPHVLVSIGASIRLLQNLSSNTLDRNISATYLDRNGYSAAKKSENSEFTMNSMKTRVLVNSIALFGEFLDKRTGQVMVTVGREAVKNKILIYSILKAGANIIRINCAHDDSAVWSEIIRNVKHNSQLLEKPCRILMDLAGPKLRTGLLKTDSGLVKLSPKKDYDGNMVFAAQVLMCCDGSNPPPGFSPISVIWIQKRFFSRLKMGDYVNFVDARGRKRSLKVLKRFPFAPNGFIADCLETAYIKAGTTFSVKGKKGDSFGQVVKVFANKQYVRLKVGDLLTIFKNFSSHTHELGSTTLGSAKITCSSDQFFESVKYGEPIAFDDGKILGKIHDVRADRVTVVVTHASLKGSKLRSGKSINVPESKMQQQLKGLTPKDFVDLDFIAANADMIGISFVRDISDVVIVQHELKKRNLPELGIILKIETKEGLQNLPSLLFQAMQTSNPLGVMIARGDLMIECGWDQLGDIQEEILCICSAAHVPVIWATQVLESLVKVGFPTRAEITDVFKAIGASCIMLNKGDNVVRAVAALNSFLSNRHRKHFKIVNPLLHFDNLVQ